MDINDTAKKYLKTESEFTEFNEYIKNKFIDRQEVENAESAYLEKWNSIIDFSKMFGCAAALNTFVCPKRPVEFNEPEQVGIEIYDSFAGKIMMISIRNTEDFENFLTNAVHRGVRPEHIGEVGASFISGKSIRFILLSAKPYSNVTASETGIAGLSDEEWAQSSLILRREHECTHYYTKLYYGSSENNLHDELIADFFGVYQALGYFSAELVLKFFGLEKSSGNRLIVYTGSLQENVRKAVYEIARVCAYNLEEWSRGDPFAKMSREQRVDILCRIGLQKIYSNDFSI